jgi:hypothetical protein
MERIPTPSWDLFIGLLPSLLRFLETVELGGFLFLVLALMFVGNKICHAFRRVRAFSVSLSALLFVAVIAFRFLKGASYSDNLAEFTLRTLLGAGFLLGTCWIVLPPIATVWIAVTDTVRRWTAGVFGFVTGGRHFIQRLGDRRQGKINDAISIEQRARTHRQAEEQAKTVAETDRRRQEARGTCELMFVTNSFEIRELFTREMFDSFVARHLGDDKAPEYVEKLAIELCGIVQKYVEKANGGAKRTLAELAEWFLNEKQQIESTALSERHKQDLLSQLEEQYVRLQQKYLRRMQP